MPPPMRKQYFAAFRAQTGHKSVIMTIRTPLKPRETRLCRNCR